MIARLQKLLSLGAAVLLLFFATVGWFGGRPVWGAVMAILVASGFAGLLAIEFCLLRWTHGSDPSPKPNIGQLLHAWWGEVLHAPLVFAWRQPFFHRRWPDHLPVSSQGQRGVLLVHGFFCNRGLWNAWMARLQAQGIPFVAVNLEPPFGTIDRHVPIIESAVLRLHAATGLAPVVVAHSMGGLSTRRWWAEQQDCSRIHRLITLGTPHHGTWLARMAFSLNGRQMRQNSPWLRALESRESQATYANCTCFYSHCDNIVFPPSTATLTGADNRHLTAEAHVHMVDHTEPWLEVQRWLAATAPGESTRR